MADGRLRQCVWRAIRTAQAVVDGWPRSQAGERAAQEPRGAAEPHVPGGLGSGENPPGTAPPPASSHPATVLLPAEISAPADSTPQEHQMQQRLQALAYLIILYK